MNTHNPSGPCVYDPYTPSDAASKAAYTKGLCSCCHTLPYQAGSPMCATCFPDPQIRWQKALEANTRIKDLERRGSGKITQEQRDLATRAANIRESSHTKRGDDRTWTPEKMTGADYHRIGILGEFAFYNEFGGTPPDLEFRAGGDTGSDSYLHLGGRQVPVDVKASTYRGPNQYLKVPVARIHTGTIYVAAIYLHEFDEVNCVCWEWSEVLMEGEVRKFPPHATPNYVRPYRDCRSMDELKALLNTDGGVTEQERGVGL